MTQEDKELILKDICARLPYGIHYNHIAWDEDLGEVEVVVKIHSINHDGYVRNCYDDEIVYIDSVKPYLFPLSSMTEEQRQELESLMEVTTVPVWGEILSPTPEYYDWLNVHHFDYRGLIEKGLAIDATELNIY